MRSLMRCPCCASESGVPETSAAGVGRDDAECVAALVDEAAVVGHEPRARVGVACGDDGLAGGAVLLLGTGAPLDLVARDGRAAVVEGNTPVERLFPAPRRPGPEVERRRRRPGGCRRGGKHQRERGDGPVERAERPPCAVRRRVYRSVRGGGDMLGHRLVPVKYIDMKQGRCGAAPEPRGKQPALPERSAPPAGIPLRRIIKLLNRRWSADNNGTCIHNLTDIAQTSHRHPRVGLRCANPTSPGPVAPVQVGLAAGVTRHRTECPQAAHCLLVHQVMDTSPLRKA